MTIKWPDAIPSSILYRGHSETFPDNIIRQGMSTGPPKRRRRTTAGIRPVSGNIVMNNAERILFDDFYSNDLIDGVMPFEFVEPRTGYVCNTIFMSEPVTTPLGRNENGVIWNVDVKLGILQVAGWERQVPFIHFPFTEDLEDLEGNVTGAIFSRDSDATYFRADDSMLVTAIGQRRQLFTPVLQNPTSSNGPPNEWFGVETTIDSNGGVIASTKDSGHLIRLTEGYYDNFNPGSTLILSIKVKANTSEFLKLQISDTIMVCNCVLDIANGVHYYNFNTTIYGVERPDEEGYCRAWIGLNTSSKGGPGLTIWANAYRNSDQSNYSGDGVTPELWIKELNLNEMPSNAVLGIEEVINGDFSSDPANDWLWFGDFSWSNNKMIFTPGASGAIYQTLFLEYGELYRIMVTISQYTAGHVYINSSTSLFQESDGVNPPEVFEGDGTHVRYMVAISGTDDLLRVNCSSVFNGAIDDVSVCRVPAYVGRQVFGTDIIPYESKDPVAGQTYWVETRCFLTEDGGIVSNTEDNTHYINIPNKLVQNYYNIVKVKAKAADFDYMRITMYDNVTNKWGTNIFNIATGQIEAQASGSECLISSISDEDGYFECTLVRFIPNNTSNILLIYPNENNYDSAHVGDNSTVKIYVKDISLKSYDPNPIPIPYTPENIIEAQPRFEADGLHIVPEDVTNYIGYTEDFSMWSHFNGAVANRTLEVVDPMGTYGAFKLEGTTSDQEARIATPCYDFNLGDFATFSIFVKPQPNERFELAFYSWENQSWAMIAVFDVDASGNVTYNESLSTNVLHTKIKNVYSGWIRVSATYEVTLTELRSTLFFDRTGSNSSIFCFGANATKTKFTAPYIPSFGFVNIMAGESLEYSNATALEDIMRGEYTKGTAAIEIKPEFSTGDYEGNIIVASGAIQFPTLINMNGWGWVWKSDDSPETPNAMVNCDYQADDILKIVIAWDKNLAKGYTRVQVDRNGIWYLGDYFEYSGQMLYSGVLIVYRKQFTNDGQLGPAHLKNLKFFKLPIII